MMDEDFAYGITIESANFHIDDFIRYPQTRIAYVELNNGSMKVIGLTTAMQCVDKKESSQMEITWEIPVQWR
jgi:hypothetical protein